MPDTRAVVRSHEDEAEHRRKLAILLDQVLAGKTNNVLDITLDADAVITRITRNRVCCDTKVSLMPKTASAAASVGSIWVEVTNGMIVINHDSQPSTDRTFGATLVG